MSLKVEQILNDFTFFTEDGPQLYTTGACLVPLRMVFCES